MDAPRAPIPKRYMAADTTIEKLARALSDNPRGLLVAREELSGLIKSFGEYKKSESGDVERWLSLHDGAALIVDRVSLGAAPIYLPRALVSIAGCATPGSFGKAIGDAGRENGLAARLLPAMPPRRRRHWSESVVSTATLEEYQSMVHRLTELEGEIDEDGWMAPVPVTLSTAAKGLFIRCFDDLSEREHDAAGELERAILGKAAGHTLRLTLVLHLAEQAVCAGDSLEISGETTERGIALGAWFNNEALRVQACLGLDPEESAKITRAERLEEWIRERGGSVAPRDLLGGGPRPRPESAADARELLDELVTAGTGTWTRPRQVGPGRPADPIFVLLPGEPGSSIPICPPARGVLS